MGLLLWDNANRTRIGRLRVRGVGENANPRLAMSGMLEGADLRPPELSPATVLIVRHMNDPLPGRLSPQRRLGLVDAAWERAARENLAGFYRRAARPGRGPVPIDADAVVFADESELLASLMLDLVSGRLRERWWWRSVASSSATAFPPTLATLLCDRAVWVPAALARLARQGRAVEVVRALSPSEALTVLAAISAVHGVSETTTCVVSPPAGFAAGATADLPPPSAATSDKKHANQGRPMAEEPAITPARRSVRTPPPWSAGAPPGAVPADLDRPRACLLGIALMLYHRPEAVRSASFAVGLQRWWQSQPMAPARAAPAMSQTPGSAPIAGRIVATDIDHASQPAKKSARGDMQPPPRTPAPPSRPRDVARSLATDAQSMATNAPPARPVPGDSEQTSQDSPSPVLTASPSAAGDQPATRLAVPASATEASIGEQEPAPPNHVAAANDVAVSRLQISPPDVEKPADDTDTLLPEAGLSLESGVETALGGILYLINAMCALDLPDCFETEWRLASMVGSWGILDALGRALLPSDTDHAGDPIWTALAVLSGRDTRAALGAGLPRRARYQLPIAWSEQMTADASEPRAWAANGRRLRIWNHAGYVLSETCRGSPPDARMLSAALPRERFANAPLATLSGPLIACIDPALRRWLSLAVPFIRRRLIRALGIDPTAEGLHEALLSRRGHLHVTPTHVDLVMRLDAVSLPVRVSGLDRNPGWLVAFNRVILFHFE
ncbi:MAG TPA: hypothetical protein VMU81_15345 [Acetobacteraceae bacterium]|nr:hypothetical protein [Acetobacteraceae bacterium]